MNRYAVVCFALAAVPQVWFSTGAASCYTCVIPGLTTLAGHLGQGIRLDMRLADS
jgi:hypothetical protein